MSGRVLKWLKKGKWDGFRFFNRKYYDIPHIPVTASTTARCGK
jgi:hypothetical protein